MLKPSPNSPLAYFFLAFIAMAGTSYINFLPGVVSALAGGIGFSDPQAGQVVAFNGYGALLGSLAAIFLVRRVSWQPVMLKLFALLAVVEAATLWLSDYSIMLGWRLLAGLLGGLCMGIAFAVLARLNNPDRAFGFLLFIQFSIGALVIYLLPLLEAQLGAYAVFYVMAALVVLSLLFLRLLPAFSLSAKPKHQPVSPSQGQNNGLLLMLAIIFYNCAASAVWAYIELIGQGAGMDDGSVGAYIATTSLLGLLGAMLPVISTNRVGRLPWIICGIVFSVAAAVMLNLSPLTPRLYVAALALLFFSWPAVLSYLLAVTAETDRSGRLSTIASVVSLAGTASGPMIAAAVIGDGSFSAMLHTCVIIFLISALLLLKPVKAREKAAAMTLSPQC